MEISSALYIFLEDKKRVDKFGPEDGYPSIVGLNIVHFLQERIRNNEMDKFREIIKGVHFIPYDETKVDARTDRSSDILGLLWRKGPMDLYNSEDYAEVCDYVFQIDLDRNDFRIIANTELSMSFDEIANMTDDQFMEKIELFF